MGSLNMLRPHGYRLHYGAARMGTARRTAGRASSVAHPRESRELIHVTIRLVGNFRLGERLWEGFGEGMPKLLFSVIGLFAVCQFSGLGKGEGFREGFDPPQTAELIQVTIQAPNRTNITK